MPDSQAATVNRPRTVTATINYVADTGRLEAFPHPDRPIRRSAHYNVWRAFSGAPVDVPLTVCDWSSVSAQNVVEATAAFDRDGAVVWSFTAMTFRYSPAHRWYSFSNMEPHEVIVFKRFDTDADKPRFLPHTAFTDPTIAADVPPRASVEMRAIAYWYS